MTDDTTIAVAPEEGGGLAEELAYRLRQQELLAAFGKFALTCKDLDALLHEATRLCAEGLHTDLYKALERLPDEQRLLVRAGVGWAANVIGRATVGADIESPAGFALRTGEPVLSNHLGEETRFRTPKLLADHGVQRAINVVIRGAGEPFGVLEADSPVEGRFTEADLAFMQGFANLLGVAIERQRDESELQQSEERFRLLVEGVRDYAIYMLDTEGRVASWNAGAQNLTGWRTQEVLGQRVSAFHTPAGRAQGKPEEELRIARETGVFREEAWRSRKDGSQFIADVTLTALHDASGRLRGFAKVTRDITERRQAEETRRQLYESETRFRLLVEGVQDYAIYMLDAQGHILSWNAGAERLLGYTEAEILGRHVSTFYRPEEAATGMPAEELRIAQREGRHQQEGWRVRKDGSEFYANVTVTPMFDDSGTLRGFGKITRDITERRQAEEQQRLLIDELNHRVKNTLATVQAIARLALRNADSLAAFAEGFEGRLQAIASTHDLLTASQGQHADLRDIVAAELDPYRGEGDERRVRIDGPRANLPARAALAARMAFHELATNAAKYGALSVRAGRVEVTWEVVDGPEGPRLHLRWIESHGPPVEPPKRRGFGSRLIEQALTQDLGGKVRLDFTPEGLRCTMDLPLPGGP